MLQGPKFVWPLEASSEHPQKKMERFSVWLNGKCQCYFHIAIAIKDKSKDQNQINNTENTGSVMRDWQDFAKRSELESTWLRVWSRWRSVELKVPTKWFESCNLILYVNVLPLETGSQGGSVSKSLAVIFPQQPIVFEIHHCHYSFI